MADAEIAPAAAPSLPATTDHGATGDRPQPKPSTSKKRAAVAKPRKTSSQVGEHPKYSAMIADAITKLKERGGSSRQAILKFILAHYKVGSEINKINARIKVSLKSGVKSGFLKQSRGTGAAGSFRLGDKKKTNSNKPRSKITKVKKPAGKSPSQKPKTAARKTKSVKSPAKKTSVKKSKVKSPAKKGKAGTKKTASRTTKPRPKKSPARKSAAQHKKPTKKIGTKK